MSLLLSSRRGVIGHPKFIDIINLLGLDTTNKSCLDAGDENSYPGSGQDWIDVSAAGNSDEFHRGGTTGSEASDPEFLGTAGGLSINERFFFDGDAYLSYGSINESWMNAIHQNNADWSRVLFFKPASDAGTKQFGFTGHSGSAGWNFSYNSSDGINLVLYNASGDTTPNVTGDDAYTNGAWHMFGVSMVEATGAGAGFIYKDGDYNQVGASDTFDATYGTPSASAGSHTARIGARSTLGTIVPNGWEIAIDAWWSGGAITKANMDDIWTLASPRFEL